MTDINEIMQMITTVGFPIVMCLLLMWYTKDALEKHKEESEKFTTALHENTLVLQRLCDKLDLIEDK